MVQIYNIVIYIIQAESTFRSELEPAGITVESRKFKTTDDPIKHIKDLFVSCKQTKYQLATKTYACQWMNSFYKIGA